jgi:hypothetical protein
MAEPTPLPTQVQGQDGTQVSVGLQSILDNLSGKFSKVTQDLVIAEETNEVLKKMYNEAVEKNGRLLEITQRLQAQVEGQSDDSVVEPTAE